MIGAAPWDAACEHERCGIRIGHSARVPCRAVCVARACEKGRRHWKMTLQANKMTLEAEKMTLEPNRYRRRCS